MIEKFKRWADKQGWYLTRERQDGNKRTHLQFMLPDGTIREIIVWADGLIINET